MTRIDVVGRHRRTAARLVSRVVAAPIRPNRHRIVSRWMVTLAAALVGIAGIFTLRSGPPPPIVPFETLATDALELEMPPSIDVGEPIPVRVSGIDAGEPARLVVDSGYGLRQFEAESDDGSAQFEIPAFDVPAVGVIALTASAGDATARSEVTLVAGPAVDPLESHVGPRTIETTTDSRTMVVIIPEDAFGNPVSDFTAVDVTVTRPDLSKLRAEEAAAAEEAALAAREAEFPSPPEPEPKERGPEVHLAPIEAEVTWPTGSDAQTGLVRVDGTTKPAAAVFAPGADLAAVPTPSIVERALKPFNFVMLTLLGIVLGGWIFLVLWDRNLFPFSLLRHLRSTDAEAPTPTPMPPPPTGRPDNSRPPPPPHAPPATAPPIASPSTKAPTGKSDPVTAPIQDLANPTDQASDLDENVSPRRKGRVRAWFSRPILTPAGEASDGDADVLISEAIPVSAVASDGAQHHEMAPELDPADVGPPPAPDLDPSWEPAEPLPSAKLAEVSSPPTRIDVPQPPARPPALAGLAAVGPAIATPAPSPQSRDGRAHSRSLAVDVLPQPRRAAQASVGDIAVLEVDLQAIDRALAYSPRPEIGDDVSRYGSFMIRTACIVTEECARTGGEPITVEIEGHAPGRRQRVPRANEMRLGALARALHDGDDRNERRSTDHVAVRVALSGASEGRMIIAGSEDAVPVLTLIHLGKRTVTTTDSLGFQVSSEHTMGLITVAAGSSPVAADAYLARVRSILERRDWIGELD